MCGKRFREIYPAIVTKQHAADEAEAHRKELRLRLDVQYGTWGAEDSRKLCGALVRLARSRLGLAAEEAAGDCVSDGVEERVQVAMRSVPSAARAFDLIFVATRELSL